MPSPRSKADCQRLMISQDLLYGFRVPLFNLLAKRYRLTVVAEAYQKISNDPIQFDFFEIPVTSVLGVKWQHSIYKRSEGFDIIVLPFDARFVSNLFMAVACGLRGQQVFFWGIGFGRRFFGNFWRFCLAWWSAGVIVYSHRSREKLIGAGLDAKKVFVALNTVDVASPKVKNTITSRNIIFVGALSERKGLIELVDDFGEAQFPGKLLIVGEGDEGAKLRQFISVRSLDERVKLLGNITCPKRLGALYRSAVFSVSNTQAGLSVLQSFGYGVPFAVRSSALSGGEIDNITDGVNGFLVGDGRFNNFSEFFSSVSYMSDCELLSYSRCSIKYFLENATINKYSDSFSEAVSYGGR